MSGVGFLETIWQNVRHETRALRKKPVFVATAILTLGVAIGGNTAVFTVIRSVLLKPLPYPDADRMVHLSGGATPTRLTEMRAGARSFEELAAVAGPENLTLSGVGEPEIIRGVRVSAGFLRIPRIQTMIGRTFRPEEDLPGAAPVALISSSLWQRRFSADPQIAGKSAILASTVYTIIGVLPPDFQFPYPNVEVWMTVPSEWPLVPLRSRTQSPFLTVFGRLKPGVTLEQADAELKVLRKRYAAAHPTMLDGKPPRSPVEVTALKDDLVANVRPILWMLFGAVGLVLLIACANVASLLLARGTSRSRELAIRTALGAARGRIMGQLLTESILLSLAGGGLGLLIAAWSLRAIPNLTAFELPRASAIELDWVVFGFAAALSILTGLLFGLTPSFGASRPDLMSVLRASGPGGANTIRTGILRGVHVRQFLVVGQIALSVVLLIGAALLIESIAQLRRVNVGFNPMNLLTAQVSLPVARYDTDQKKSAFFEQLVERLDRLPGVRGTTAALFLPMMGYAGTPVQDASKPLLKLNERPLATIMTVTPGYLRTLEIPLRRGREFNAHDTMEAQRVTIIDEALARRFWPSYPEGQDPIGQRLMVGGAFPKPAQIVGIVADIHQNLENSAWPETVYLPYAQNPQPFATIAIRTAGDPMSFAKAVREQVKALDDTQTLAAVRTMDNLMDAQVGQRRLLMILLAMFACVALLLAVIGIHGIIAYSVAQRTQEVGIRRALGAQETDILRMVIGQGLILAVAGVAVGLLCAFAVTRVMKTLLFHVSSTDPATFAAIAVIFLLVAVAASYIPARRATRIDPMSALRI